MERDRKELVESIFSRSAKKGTLLAVRGNEKVSVIKGHELHVLFDHGDPFADFLESSLVK